MSEMKPTPRYRGWKIRLTVGLVVVLPAVFFGWYEDLPARGLDTLAETTSRAGFQIEEVWTEDPEWTELEDLARVLESTMGASSLLLDVDGIRRRVEELDWVAHAEVSVRLPDRLDVRIQERRPTALWQYEGEFYVVDDAGTVIEGAPAANFPDLLHVVGKGAPEAFPGLARILVRAPDIASRIFVASWVSERRWTLYTHGKVEIHLPAEGAAAALSLLHELVRRHEIFARDIERIDLRITDRMTVRMRNGRKLAMPSETGA